MKSTNIFMKGHWEDLIMTTFEIDEAILKPYLPKDTQLDLYNGKTLLSMVAFRFTKVRFFGFNVLMHQNFGQINFRFYVKSKIDNSKGVVFIKEFAPKPLITWVANIFYNEPYHFKNITYNKYLKNKKIALEYNYKTYKTKAKGSVTTHELTSNTLEHFVVARYIAFINNKDNKTLQYKIQHKPWRLYNLENSYYDKELLNLLPKPFKKLKYISTCFVNGSSVAVEKGKIQ
ncbi:DUF2071 domain-containing protein [Mariniflexile litorale]|uniref:DUF2071 domain-containing protein n=1 Tax=Mariniflexile litorale TaxID=3045158 RepID=A0AAU7EAP3_9FLAO|nr:DUF2071 domain-containing protein [Mariniflexile sp. KMM 9835]MDQ8213422.1 DUF2071 domain-containing protein [Mariniflexile sp. KMM 9835]